MKECCKFPEMLDKKEMDEIGKTISKEVDPDKDPEFFSCVRQNIS